MREAGAVQRLPVLRLAVADEFDDVQAVALTAALDDLALAVDVVVGLALGRDACVRDRGGDGDQRRGEGGL